MAGPTLRSFSAYALYSPTDRLDIMASVSDLDGMGPNGTFYALRTNYHVTDNFTAEAGDLKINGGMGDQNLVSLSIGIDF